MMRLIRLQILFATDDTDSTIVQLITFGKLKGLYMPAAWTAGDITLKVGTTVAVVPVHDHVGTGAIITVQADAARYIPLESLNIYGAYVQIIALAAQLADRDFILVYGN